MTLRIVNAPVALENTIPDLCAETYRAHRDAQPQTWPENFFEAVIRPGLQLEFDAAKRDPSGACPLIFAAYQDDEFAGYMWISALPTAPSGDVYGTTIRDIYVLPDFRGKGIARALINHVKDLSKTHDWDGIGATVASWNDASRQLFESEGFKVRSHDLHFGPDRSARDYPVRTMSLKDRASRWYYPALVILLSAIIILNVLS